MTLPERHWRSYDRCFKDTMLNEAHTSGRRREMPLRVLLARMRHDGCGGIAGELLTGIESASSCPVRKIALIANPMLAAASYRRR